MKEERIMSDEHREFNNAIMYHVKQRGNKATGVYSEVRAIIILGDSDFFHLESRDTIGLSLSYMGNDAPLC